MLEPFREVEISQFLMIREIFEPFGEMKITAFDGASLKRAQQKVEEGYLKVSILIRREESELQTRSSLITTGVRGVESVENLSVTGGTERQSESRDATRSTTTRSKTKGQLLELGSQPASGSQMQAVTLRAGVALAG
ncbi:hypothetical protein PoB_001439100 [Plakobranchus ocellatus]|uniref:Uncharacterized protein n=1 Tax=Plakobranchus ocellatus TaxID=259542 RepID=A0AAV3YWM4_9GAST|nr:hypothetical protein PoB_001439100 [Plakobranchus ocellatus]